MTIDQRAELIRRACEVRQLAHSPYSNFRVGAALLTDDGNIFVGTNIENASYGLTICAERVAIGSAVAAGHRHFVAMAVATPGMASPCGACRQVVAEFAPSLPILLVDADMPNRTFEINLSELLPHQFGLAK